MHVCVHVSEGALTYQASVETEQVKSLGLQFFHLMFGKNHPKEPHGHCL